MKIQMTVNGVPRENDVEPRTLLVQYIREQLGLTGTNIGCDTSSCGACTVHLDGEPIRSCVRPIETIEPGAKIVTIEGLAPGASHPLQRAWVELDVPQCGFCQSGMLMAAAALLKAKPKPTDQDIDETITNVCRCGTYNRVRAAIHLAATGQRNAALESGMPPAQA